MIAILLPLLILLEKLLSLLLSSREVPRRAKPKLDRVISLSSKINDRCIQLGRPVGGWGDDV